jgi:hypothetical protein
MSTSELNSFTEGLRPEKLGGKWGYIDKNGDEIIPLKYDKANHFDWINNKAVVELDGQGGTIDTEGVFTPK